MPDKNTGFVIFHFGPIGPEKMLEASELAGDGAVMSPNAARMAGASFAFGSAELIADIQRRLAASVREEIRAKYPTLSNSAAEWLATGERGLSSDAMFTRLARVDLHDELLTNHPHDPDDLRRCRLLLESVPGFGPRLSEMASVSPVWARLCQAWTELCKTMDDEFPAWRDSRGAAPRTYELMQKILHGA